jgi:predicted RNA-binding Zn ribbon-like protein
MEQKAWDFDSGNLVLDFANTAEFHASDSPDEMLESFPDLLSWSQAAGILSRDEAEDLINWAEENPGEAAQELSKALALREVIYQVLSASANQESINESDLSTFNDYLSESLLHSRITHGKENFRWSWDPECNSADRIQWALVRAAADLITSKDIKRVGECADDRGCGYLFIDTSRNHSRRWCSMEACGNRAKAQRHYQKTTQG